jgi:membrane protein DedA with SNARE-associated domain
VRPRFHWVDEALAHLSPVTSQVQGLIDFVGSHPHFALIAIFLLALSEAVPVVGTVVPGSTAILGISALATTAQLDPWLLLIAATLGAIAGDGFSFWLGRRYRAKVLRGWPLNRYPQLIARSKAYIEGYGIASVFIARFTAVVRAFVPMLAGVLRMSPPQFYAANVASALVWAPMHVFPGVLLAMAIRLAGTRAEQLILVALAVAILGSALWGLLRGRSRERAAAAPIRPSRLLALQERSRQSGG